MCLIPTRVTPETSSRRHTEIVYEGEKGLLLGAGWGPCYPCHDREGPPGSVQGRAKHGPGVPGAGGPEPLGSTGPWAGRWLNSSCCPKALLVWTLESLALAASQRQAEGEVCWEARLPAYT